MITEFIHWFLFPALWENISGYSERHAFEFFITIFEFLGYIGLSICQIPKILDKFKLESNVFYESRTLEYNSNYLSKTLKAVRESLPFFTWLKISYSLNKQFDDLLKREDIYYRIANRMNTAQQKQASEKLQADGRLFVEKVNILQRYIKVRGSEYNAIFKSKLIKDNDVKELQPEYKWFSPQLKKECDDLMQIVNTVPQSVIPQATPRLDKIIKS